MRFLTFVKSQKDKDILIFWEWIQQIGYAKKSPHAGVAQIALLLDVKRPDVSVWKGFDKAETEYKKHS